MFSINELIFTQNIQDRRRIETSCGVGWHQCERPIEDKTCQVCCRQWVVKVSDPPEVQSRMVWENFHSSRPLLPLLKTSPSLRTQK